MIPDSLQEQAKKSSSNTGRISFLIDKAAENSFNDPGLSIELAEEARLLALKIKNDTLVMQAVYYAGTAYINQGFYRLALKIQSEGLQIAIKTKKTVWEARFRNDLGIIHDFLGNWNKALEEYYQTLRIFYSMADSSGVAKTLNNIGLIKLASKQYGAADSFLKASLQIGEQQQSADLQAMALSNMGMLYIELKKYPQALHVYKKVLELDLSEDKPNYAFLGSDYSNLANCYLGLKKYDTAWYYESKGLQIKKQVNNQRGISTCYAGLADILYEKRDYSLALVYLDSALKMAEITEDPGLIASTYGSIAEVLSSSGRFKEAYLAMQHHQRYADSLYNHENLAEGSRLEKEFEAERTHMQLDMLNTQLQNKKREGFYLLLSLILFFLLTIILVIQSRINKTKNTVLASKQEKLDLALAQLTEKNTEIARQKDILEDALQVKSKFLSMVSHEIRTPLNVILGLSEILKKEDLSGNQKNNVSVLNNASLQLIALFNDILDLNKIESGNVEMHFDDFDLENCLESLASAYRIQAEEKGLKFEKCYFQSLPKRISGDRLKLEQVLNNILNNAIKFTENGGITFSVSINGKNSSEQYLLFEIKDTGIGIAEEDRKIIFAPFQQVTRKNKSYGGTGLGLSISSSLVSMMGGELQVDSEPGKGTRFFFSIPFKPAEEKDTGGTDAIKPEKGHYWPVDRRILIAEDHPQNIFLLKKILENMPGHYDWVVNGKEAVDAALANRYDLVLMDMHMPEMDGYTAGLEIRKGNLNKDVVILGLTATDKSEIATIKEGVFNDFLIKPYLPAELYDKMSRFLN